MKMLSTNRERLRQRIESLGAVGLDAEGKRNRLALSDGDKAGRDVLVQWLHEVGLDVKIDGIGNIWGLLPGCENGNPVTAGSHIDTVRNAGMFDGAVGVLAGLEVLQTVKENGVKLKRTLAVVAFTNEEGARFHPDLMGSLYLCGQRSAQELYSCTDDEGLSVGHELRRIGYLGTDEVTPSCYLELHVEQGPFLDKASLPLGVVQGVQGISWWHCRYTGQANHAGSTPMDLRRDALLAFSRLHVALTDLAIRQGAVVTVGCCTVEPHVVNIVPGSVTFTVDLRHPESDVLDRLKGEAELLMKTTANENHVALDARHTVDVAPVNFDPHMISLVEHCAEKRNIQWGAIASGACHDAQILSHLVPSAMIFVPSIGGLSHCPEERSDFEQISAGADVLLDCLLELAR